MTVNLTLNPFDTEHRKQESRRVFGTAVSRVVMHLNKVHLNQILTIAHNVQIALNLTSNLTLTLKVTPNVAATLNPTFHFGGGYLVQCLMSPNVALIMK